MWTKDNKPWIILNEKYTSRDALMARLRDIAVRHNWQASGLHELSQADEAFVLAFFAQHSSIEEKIGAGVNRVLVGSSRFLDPNGFHNWCYFFETIDRETPIDVGAKSCFESFSKLDDFIESCYTAIALRSTAIMNRDFGVNNEMLCPETGELVTKQECFVAHCEPSMRQIVNKFIAEHSIDVVSVETTGKTRRSFQDLGLAQLFFDFHGTMARMRVVGRTAFYKRMQRTCMSVPLARDSVGV